MHSANLSARRWQRFSRLYALLLLAATAYLLLYFFVLPHGARAAVAGGAPAHNRSNAAVTGTTYRSDEINVEITQYREYNCDIYVADIQVSDPAYLKTAFAQDTFGSNIEEYPHEYSARTGAIVGISGDNYGKRETGYVLRGGQLYRDTLSDPDDPDFTDLAIWADGSFTIETEAARSAEQLQEAGVLQTFSFGPALVENGQVSLSSPGQTSHLESRHPRAVLAAFEPLHYAFVVVDGRTEQSVGITLQDLADFMYKLGVQTAYNLDGGGTACLMFNGEIVNHPTGDGKKSEERHVSDFVYVG